MKESLVLMALSDKPENHQLILGFIKNGLITINELIFGTIQHHQNNFLSDKLNSDKEPFKEQNIEYYELLGCISVTARNNTFQNTIESFDFESKLNSLFDVREYCYFPMEKELPIELINFVTLELDKKINPDKYLDNRISEIILFIKRNDSTALKFQISSKTISRFTRLIKAGRYDSILFLYGFKFISILYTYFLNSRIFEAAEKIEQAVEKANSFFNPENKLTLN